MKFGIIGYGNMSSAIAKAAKEFFRKNETQLFVFTPSERSSMKAKEDLKETNFHQAKNIEEVCEKAKLILFGVKPQMLLDLLYEHSQALQGRGIVSIAAGLTSITIRDRIGEGARVQRVMPNLGALVGKGMTLISQENTLEKKEFEYVLSLFESIGKVKILPESLMDIGSVLSGSSGAFYTMFVEAMAEAGLRRGLNYQDALELSLQNHLGTILQIQGGMDPSVLRIDTSSPAGTTIEGVLALDENAFRSAVHEAVEATYQRCIELSKQ